MVSICTGLLWLVVTASSRTGSKNGFKIGSRPAGKGGTDEARTPARILGRPARPTTTPNSWPPRGRRSRRGGSPPRRGDRTPTRRWPGGARRRERLRLGTSVRAAVRAHPDRVCDGRDDPRPPQRGPAHPGSRGLGSAGRRGLVRPVVSQAAGPDPANTSTSSGRCGPARKPVTSDGPHYPLPLKSDRATGLGKPLKPITHPLRSDIPISSAPRGPKNVALAAEVCDGWLPIFYTPRMADNLQRVAGRGVRPTGRNAVAARDFGSARRPTSSSPEDPRAPRSRR